MNYIVSPLNLISLLPELVTYWISIELILLMLMANTKKLYMYIAIVVQNVAREMNLLHFYSLT